MFESPLKASCQGIIQPTHMNIFSLTMLTIQSLHISGNKEAWSYIKLCSNFELILPCKYTLHTFKLKNLKHNFIQIGYSLVGHLLRVSEVLCSGYRNKPTSGNFQVFPKTTKGSVSQRSSVPDTLVITV